ncbi:MAG: hypothetical protein ACI4AM_06465 [Muribaculaceae bacterium]
MFLTITLAIICTVLALTLGAALYHLYQSFKHVDDIVLGQVNDQPKHVIGLLRKSTKDGTVAVYVILDDFSECLLKFFDTDDPAANEKSADQIIAALGYPE